MNWYSAAPIHFLGPLPNGISTPVPLGCVSLIATPSEWKVETEIAGYPNRAARDWFRDDNVYSLFHEYEADDAGAKQKHARRVLWHASLALWLAGVSSASIEFYFHALRAPGDADFYQEKGTMPTIVPHVRDSDTLDVRGVAQSDLLSGSLQSLGRGTRLDVAATFLVLALSQREWPTRYALAWTALETVVGSEDYEPRIGQRLSRRVACMLSTEETERREVCDYLRMGYVVRSDIVHGRARNVGQDDPEEFLFRVEAILRQLLAGVLLDSELVVAFSGPEREDYLRNITAGFDASA